LRGGNLRELVVVEAEVEAELAPLVVVSAEELVTARLDAVEATVVMLALAGAK
jgi:hypothetical protein